MRGLEKGIEALEAALKGASRFGKSSTSEGILLYGHTESFPVPWFHIVYPKLSGEYIGRLETNLKRTLPLSYEAFLRQHNGLYLFAGELVFWGGKMPYSDNLQTRQENDLLGMNRLERPYPAKDEWLIFAKYKEGDLAFMDEKTGGVWKGNKDLTEATERWESLEDFMKDEIERLSALFDERGKKKKK